MLMINSSPVQLEAKVCEMELQAVEEAPLYQLEELRDRLGEVQIRLTKVQDRVEDVSQRLVKIQTIYAYWISVSPLSLLEHPAQAFNPVFAVQSVTSLCGDTALPALCTLWTVHRQNGQQRPLHHL